MFPYSDFNISPSPDYIDVKTFLILFYADIQNKPLP